MSNTSASLLAAKQAGLLITTIQQQLNPAWRLQRQEKARAAGRKSVLPEHLLATPGNVREAFHHLRREDTRLAGMGRLLRAQAKTTQALAGDIAFWAQDVALSWHELFVRLESGVDAALRLGADEALFDDKAFTARVVTDQDWSVPGRAAVDLGFALRAYSLITSYQARGELPEGAYAKRFTDSAGSPGQSASFVQHAICQANGQILGQGDMLETAAELAKLAHLSCQPTSQLSFEQFREITTTASVIKKRNRSGGTEFQLDDPEDLAFRAFFSRAFEYARHAGLVELAAERQGARAQKQAWINNAIKTALAAGRDEVDVINYRFPGAGYLVLENGGPNPHRESILRDIYQSRALEAIEAGEPVAELALRDLGLELEDGEGSAGSRAINVDRPRGV